MSAALIHCATLVQCGAQIPDSCVPLAPGGVTAIGTGASWRSLVPGSEPQEETQPRSGTSSAVHVVDAAGGLLTPGFVDLHGHGALDVGYENSREPHEVLRAVEHHRAHGSTHQVVSLSTSPLPATLDALALVPELTGPEHGVLGSHLEGPWLAHGHCGAHNPALLRTPDPAGLYRLLSAAAGTLVQVILAPELPDALEPVASRAAAAGVVPAVGHTDADAATTRRAFDAGTSLLAHAFKGMAVLHHRAPGPVAAALTDGHQTLEVFNDGAHVDPTVVRLLTAAARGRVALITDAGAATGEGDGKYRLGPLAVMVRDGVARLRERGSLAGSTLTLDAALRRAMHDVGLPLPQAVDTVSRVLADVLGRADLGRLTLGGTHAGLLTRDLRVRTVWFDGRTLFDHRGEE